MNPAIVLVAPEHGVGLADEFHRYDRDYDVHLTRSAAEAEDLTQMLVDDGRQVAMLVAESELPDGHVLQAFARLRAVVPSARRLVAAHRSRFLVDADALRGGLAGGKFDAYLLMPQGPRDEEFHTAVCELLSDWGSTVASPEVETVRIVTPAADALIHGIRDFLDRMGMPNRTHDPDSAEGRELVEAAGPDPVFPLLRAMDGEVFSPQSVRDVAIRVYGSPTDVDVSAVVDVAVVGAGPAGLATSVYASSEGLRTVVLEAEAVGGQAGTSSMIRNYLGFPRGVSGMRLAQRARGQAIRFGTRFLTGWTVTALEPGARGEPHVLRTDGGGDIRARSVVVATGVSYRKLRVPGVEALVGSGVFYGSAMTAAREMEGADVVVVGGGNSAGQAAIHVARFARSVTIMVRRDGLESTMSRYLIAEISHNPRITVLPRAEVVDAGGDGRLEWITLRDTGSGSTDDRPCQGLFLLLGAEPHCEWLPADVARDSRGFVLTGRDVPTDLWVGDLPPASLETTVPGVFAAGDIRSASMKRVASASGEGASVVPLVHAWLESGS